MSMATITSKGQVTIPKPIRESLKLEPGDRIEFILTRKGEVLIKPVTRKVDEVFARLRKYGKHPVSVEDMNQLVAKRMKEKSG